MNYIKGWSKPKRLEDVSFRSNRSSNIMFRFIWTSLYWYPDVVAINEAVELAKSYSDDKVKNMINKVLDNVYKEKIN